MPKGNIQGITIEFEGKTTKLEQAMRSINNSTKSLDSELNKVKTALKFNPTNVELWRQKQTILSEKIDQTKKNLENLKDVQKQMDASGVDKNSAEYRQLQREIITTESKLKTFTGQLKQVGNVKLRAVSEQFKELGTNLTNAGQAMAPISAAGAVVAGSLGALAVKSGQAADDLNTLSKVTGLSAQQLQLYKAGADLVDVSVETIARSQQKLTKSISSASDGTGQQAEAFKKLGVSVTNADGSLKSTDQVFNETIQALSGVSNETERNALAMTLMGKSAQELNPLIEDGGKTYQQLAQTMAENNLKFVDQETLDGANRFNDALDTLKASGLATLQTLGTQLASYLAPAMETIAGALEKVLGWLSQLSPQTLTIIGVVAALIAGIAPVLIFLGKLSFAISSITSLMSTLGISFTAIAGPVGIVIAILAALVIAGIAVYKNWDTIKAKGAQAWNAIKTTITTAINNAKTNVMNVANAIKMALSTAWTAIKTTATTMWNNIKNAITKPFEKAKELVKGIIDKIKGFFPIRIGNLFGHIKLPHFNISWSQLGNTKLKIPHFNGINWYAQGGIFDTPTVAGIGEAGPEAVVPLNKFWDKLDKMGGNAFNITININGSDKDPKQIAREVKRELIGEVKRERLAW